MVIAAMVDRHHVQWDAIPTHNSMTEIRPARKNIWDDGHACKIYVSE